MMGLFKKKKPKAGQEETVIVFHEDFYRQVEFVPEENYFERNNYINNLPPNQGGESGFEHCIAREEQPIKTSTRQIPLEEIRELLSPLASSFFTHVEAAYGTTVTYRKENTVVWGFDGYGIFVETDKADIVQNIYITHNSHFDIVGNGIPIAKALILLGQKHKLVLIDWDQEIVIRIALKHITYQYLRDTYHFKLKD